MKLSQILSKKMFLTNSIKAKSTIEPFCKISVKKYKSSFKKKARSKR